MIITLIPAVLFLLVSCQTPHKSIIVHFDLKGAPPRPTYFKQLLSHVSDLGGTGVLIEWEDMFPYDGVFDDIINGNAYSKEEVFDILQHANSLGLTVIPLIQSLGHMEWILKTEKFSHLREDPSYPMVACIGDSRAVDVILNSINQVLTLHSKFPTPFVHIGGDEAFQIGICEADKEILPVKYGNDSRRLIFDHIRSVAKNITENHPRTQVLLWFDEFKTTSPFLIKEYGLDKAVTPVVWKYTGDLDKDLPPELWTNLSVSFSSIWGGSAFKGANGANQIWNQIKPYVQNNKQWFLQSVKYSDLFSDFHGIILTGWQRYDHFASLCELWPVSMASLAINLKIVKNFVLTEEDKKLLVHVLSCPPSTSVNDLLIGSDQCRFPGYKIRDSIREFIQTKTFFENSSWIHNREAGWLQESHMLLNASSAFYVEAIGNAYKKHLNKIDRTISSLRSSMSSMFFEDVFVEFTTDYIMPFYDELKRRWISVSGINRKKTYPARPWLTPN